MESLMAGGGDGSSDSFHVDFLEPKRNMIYILDGNQNLKILSVKDIPLVKRLWGGGAIPDSIQKKYDQAAQMAVVRQRIMIWSIDKKRGKPL